MKKAAIYVKQKVNSCVPVKSKVERCQDYARQNKLDVTHVYCDCVKNNSIKRYDLERLLNDCKEHKFECVVILSVENLTRKIGEFRKICSVLKKNGIELLTTLDENKDVKNLERMGLLK